MAQMALRSKVSGARAYWRALLASEGSVWTLAVLVAAFVACFHIDRLLVLPMEARIVAWGVMGILFTLGVALLVLRPVLRNVPDEAVAVMVERQYPHLRERLLSAVEFANVPEERLRGMSPVLLDELRTDAEREAGGLNFRSAFHPRGLLRASSLFGLVILFLGLHLLFAGPAFGRFVARMGGSNLPVWRDTRVQVDPLDTKMLRGTDLTVSVGQDGRHISDAVLHFRFGNGRWNTVKMKASARGSFSHQFAGVTEDLHYYATGGDGRSDIGDAVVVDPASIVGAKLHLDYPAYMQKPGVDQIVDSGGIAAPVGTTVRVELKANKAIETAMAELPKEAPKAWEVRGDTVAGSLVVKGNGQYSVRLRDRDGFDAPQAQVFPIKAIPDQAPEVQLLDPTGDLDVVPDAKVMLSISAKDDYGLAEIRVPHEVQGRKPESITAATAKDHKTKSLDIDSRWDLASLKLKPGDTVKYRIEAADWDNVSGPHVGKTSDLQLRIIDRGEAERRHEELRNDLLRQMGELIREQKSAKQDVDNQRNAAKPNPEAVAAAEERQRAAAATAQDLAKRIADMNRMAETNGLSDPQDLQTQKQAAGNLDKVAKEAMPQAANKIGQAQTQAQSSPQQSKQDLGQASQQQQQIVSDLEKIQEQLKPGSELKRLAERFDRLAKEQRALQAKSDKMLPETLGKAMSELTPQQREALQRNAQQQSSLQKATQQAMQDLENSAKSMEGRSPEQAEAARETNQDLKSAQTTEQQEQAQQSTQQNSLGQARSQQEQAAKALEKAAENLKAAQNANDPKALERQLRQAMNELGKMMQQQQDLQNQSKGAMSQQQRQEAAKQQQDLQRKLEELARQLEKLQRRSPSAGQASKETQEAGKQSAQASQSLQQGQQDQAQKQQQKTQQAMQRAMQSLQQAMAEAQKQDDPFAELRKKLTALSTKQKAVLEATRRIDTQQTAKGTQPDDAAELKKLAQKQAEVEDEAQKLEPELPGEVFKSFSRNARKAMDRSKDGLGQANPKANPTQQAQSRAHKLIDQLVQALDPDPKDNSEEQGGGGGGGQGGGKGPDPELLKRIAEIRLLRFAQQGIRAQTEEIDGARSDATPLTEEQKQRLKENAESQTEAKAQADRLTTAMQRYKSLGQKVAAAGKHMSEAKRGLDRENTGDAVQEQESQAVIRLTEALKQAQRQAQQQQQQQQQKQQQQQAGQPQPQPGQGQPQPGSQQQGSNPAMKSTQRSGSKLDGNLGGYGPDARGFTGLDARSQDALRQAAKEKKPVEYQDLINRYLSALSNKGR